MPQYNCNLTPAWYRGTNSTWPPTPAVCTGLGLVLRQGSPLGSAAQDSGGTAWNPGTPDDTQIDIRLFRFQPAIFTDQILRQDSTILLTERIYQDNRVGTLARAAVYNAAIPEDGNPLGFNNSQHNNDQGQSSKSLHGASMFSYLYLDGHAELAMNKSTLGATNVVSDYQTGAWTINPND